MLEQSVAAVPGDSPRRTVAFVLHHLEAGGLERVVVNLLCHLDRGSFRPVLVLFERRGSLLDAVPADVPVLDLGGGSARRLVLPLARMFAKMAPHVVYAGTNAVVLACLAASMLRRGRPPVIVGQHTTPGAYLREAKLARLRLALMRQLYPRAAIIAAPALELGEELRRILGLPKLPVIDVPNPVIDAQGMLPLLPPARPVLSGAERRPCYLAAGRLAPVKGFDLLLGAFALLCREEPAARLTICGDGEERPNLEALSRRLGIAERIEMPGFVADPIRRLGPGRIFVMSSRREGFPNVLVEALAAGMPIVSTDCPVGPRLVLQGGRCGLLAPAGDAEALSAGMLRLYRDQDLADSFQRLGPERAAPFEVHAAVQAFSRLFLAIAARGAMDREAAGVR